ncbi:XdhC family protein [Halomonas litopenaei]|uniref:XdhC family protein n=1 Tax=Halomonas litopenaei TaxID=2109328 RepID=UPI003FA0FD6F
MQHLDLTVVRRALTWLRDGRTLWLATVLSTYGSSPREPGAWLAATRDGEHVGSLSGGCVEEDFLERLGQGDFDTPVRRVRYGAGDDVDYPAPSLPCGGVLDVLVERFAPDQAALAHLSALEAALEGRKPLIRRVKLDSGARALVQDDGLGDRVVLVEAKGETSAQLRVGPAARLLLAGVSPVAIACAQFAVGLGFEVIVCDPRDGMLDELSDGLGSNAAGSIEKVATLPSRFIAEGGCHGATAVVALTHDPRIDDLAMIEAVRSEAFYIGVMGSLKTSRARAERLSRSGGLSDDEIARIHMPIGLNLGSKTPAEIALAVMADIVRVRRGKDRHEL